MAATLRTYLALVRFSHTVFALPFALVIPLMVTALVRAVRSDWAEHQRNEKLMRRRLREIVEK